MLRFAELILAHRDELALLETLNVGKPISSALSGDIPSAANCIAFYGEAIDKIYGEVAPRTRGLHHPGDARAARVIAAVVPWNYPPLDDGLEARPRPGRREFRHRQASRAITLHSLASRGTGHGGRSPQGCSTSFRAWGRPPGARSAFTWTSIASPSPVRPSGKLFLQYSGQSNAKRVSLELGGKSPQIVMADCDDLDAAAQAVAAGIFTNAGQVCNAGSRLIVQEGIREALLEKVVTRSKALQPGDPLDPATRLGPLVSAVQMDRVLGYIRKGQKAGAALVTGGRRALPETGGYFVEPTVFDRVENRMAIAQEEIFGPSSPPSRSPTSRRRSRWRTTPSTAWQPRSGPPPQPGASRRAGDPLGRRLCELLRQGIDVGAVRGASSNPVSDATSPCTPSTSTWISRRSGSPRERGP